MNQKIAVAVFAMLGLSSAAPSYAQWYVGASAGKSIVKFDDVAQSVDTNCAGMLMQMPQLPNSTAIFAHHGLTGFAGKSLFKLRHIYHQAIDAIFAR